VTLDSGGNWVGSTGYPFKAPDFNVQLYIDFGGVFDFLIRAII
jgi:hypothetical protein